MPSSSLGDNFKSETFSSKRDGRVVAAIPISSTLPSLTSPVVSCASQKVSLSCMNVPRGLVPTLAYSAVALLIPLLVLYVDVDFTSDTTRGLTIGVSAIAALVAVLANDCCCWYNMILAFHTALEVKVVDTAITFAYAEGTSDADMALAITGAIIVVVHLLPFFVSDHLTVLGVLAFAGVVVNAAILVYLDDSLLLLVGASSVFLLTLTMIVSGVCEIKTSLLSITHGAMVSKKCLMCDNFEL